jgi:hypothetical protein
MFGHNAWESHTNLFNAFSDESVILGEGNNMKSRGIDVPAWSFVNNDDEPEMSGAPVETFERTFVAPFGTIKQTKKVLHPDPANQVGDAWVGGQPMFDVKIRSELTHIDGVDTPSNFIEHQVEDPFNPSSAKWELSGLDDWFETSETEEEEDADDQEPEEEIITITPPPAEKDSKTGLYILGGVGVLAAGYLYFIIRNPQAYVQATAIKTGGGLVSQMLG